MACKQVITLFDAGDKNGKLLAMLTADTYMPTVVPCVYGADGILRSSAEEVLQTFVDFYKSLYSPIPPYVNTALLGFSEGLNMSALSDETRLSLDAPFTGEVVALAIDSFPNGKSPGSNGLPVEWYQYYMKQLSPHLLTLYNECLGTNYFPLSFYEANVMLLAKQDKDPLLCSSYRPNALLNMDLKEL